MEVFTKIFEDYGVYLLASLITERELLNTQLEEARTAEEVKVLNSKLEGERICAAI